MEEERGLSKTDMKISNRFMVLKMIKQEQPISRIQLSKLTNMSPTSMTRIINDLSELNLVCEVNFATNTLGRKAMLLALNKDAYYSLGITISKRIIRMTIINFSDEVLYTKSYHMDISDLKGKEIAQFIYLNYPEFMTEAEDAVQLELRQSMQCIGTSFPGIVDKTHKKVLTTPQFEEEVKDSLFFYLHQLFHLPIYVENDIKAALYNESRRFNGTRESVLAYLFLDVGIGAALMIDGEIFRGNTCGAGEIAFATIGEEGNYYHRLTYTYINEQLNKEGFQENDLKGLAKQYEAGNKKAVKLVELIAESLARVINTINVFYNPSKLILGGFIIHDLPMIKELALQKKEIFYGPLIKKEEIVAANEPKTGDAVGAAIIAKEEYLKEMLFEKWMN